jgi:hypothetical protein
MPARPLRLLSLALVLAGALLGSGCTTTAILVHLHDRFTEGDPPPCRQLNPVARALEPRCGAPAPGSLMAADLAAPGLPMCPLGLAARDERLWPVLPELVRAGAQPERCAQAPLAMLAAEGRCPDFAAAPPAAREALRWLAEADPRAVQHDVLRLLTCPSARAVGLDAVVDGWLAQGVLPTGRLAFAPLAALQPDHLDSPLARALEAQGHRARDGLGGYAGRLSPGFEEALRRGDLAALDWWFARVPELVQRVPAVREGQFSWLPLARALQPGFLPDAQRRERVVAHLLARGADPLQRLPHEPGQSVLAFARSITSPQLALLEAPVRPAPVTLAQAALRSPPRVD